MSSLPELFTSSSNLNLQRFHVSVNAYQLAHGSGECCLKCCLRLAERWRHENAEPLQWIVFPGGSLGLLMNMRIIWNVIRTPLRAFDLGVFDLGAILLGRRSSNVKRLRRPV